MNELVDELNQILANSYAIYLKTQNYHWNVESKHDFRSLHLMFEDQYSDLAEAIDMIAEKIRQLDSKVDVSFKKFLALSSIPEPDCNKSASQMIEDLVNDQETIAKDLARGIKVAVNSGDEGAADMLVERLRIHDKNRWFLKSSL